MPRESETKLRRLAEWVSPDVSTEALVLGILMVAALLVAESVRSETYPDTAGGVALLLALYWLSRSYAAAFEDRLGEGRRWDLSVLVGGMRRSLGILRGGLVPLLVLLVCWGLGLSLSTGVAAAIISAAVTLVLMEVAAGIRASEGAVGILVDTLVGATLGLGIFALKVVLH